MRLVRADREDVCAVRRPGRRSKLLVRSHLARVGPIGSHDPQIRRLFVGVVRVGDPSPIGGPGGLVLQPWVVRELARSGLATPEGAELGGHGPGAYLLGHPAEHSFTPSPLAMSHPGVDGTPPRPAWSSTRSRIRGSLS